MNSTSTLIVNLSEASLAAVTGGLGWVVFLPCMQMAAIVDAILPGFGALLIPSCVFPIL